MKVFLLLLLLPILAVNITPANAVPQIPGCTWKVDDTYTCTTPDGTFNFVCPPSEDGTCYPDDKFPEGCFDVGTPIKCPDDEKVIPLVPRPHEPEAVQKKPTYKIWVLAYNVDPKAGFVSACAFGPSVDTPNCAYFDLSKIFIEKGGKKDFIAGFVSIVSNTPADMQVCLEAQLLSGTNTSPGNWSRCGPVIKDNKGFYISKTDFTGLDHSKLGPYHTNTNTNTSTSNTNELPGNQQQAKQVNRETSTITNSSKSTPLFSAKLSGANEVPPTDSEDVLPCRCSATASFSPEGDSISYKIITTNLDAVSAAHLHMAQPGVNGDVIVDLLRGSDTSPTEQGIMITGSIDDARLTGPLEGKSIDKLIDSIKKNIVYVNLHTDTHPNGEIRGPVKPSNIAASLPNPIADTPKQDTHLVSVIVYNAKKQMGTLNICVFDGTKRISNCVDANIGKLANSNNSDRFEAALLKVKTSKNIVEDSDIMVCFDPLSEQRYSWGGCWNIQDTPEGKLYTEYDMTGLK